MTRKPGDHPDDWKPHKGPQTRFLSLTCFEALYGGAAGGGKSDCLLVDAIRYVGRGYGTKYQAILFRRTFPELEKSLILRSHDLYPIYGGRYNQQSKTWTFPDGERVLFGYMQNDDDRTQHQGAAYQFVGFDEATHFSAIQYLYLFSRCRSSHGVPCRIRSATNPGGPGHSFFFQRFGPWLDPKHPQPVAPGEVRYFLTEDDGTERRVPKGTTRTAVSPDGKEYLIPALGRVFVPAKLEDNPALLADPTYQAALAQLDPVTRAQLRHGNWLVKPGAGLYFKRAWITWLDAPPPGLRWVRAWDLAATPKTDSNDPAWTAGVKMARWVRPEGVTYVVSDVRRLRAGPGERDAFIRATAESDGRDCRVALPQDPGQAGVDQVASFKRLLAGFGILFLRPSQDKVARFAPLSAQASPPCQAVALVRGNWNDPFLDELESFPDGDKKDQADAAADAFAVVASDPLPTAGRARASGQRRGLDGY